MKNPCNLSVIIEEEERRKIKIYLATQGITLKDYIMGLISRDMAQHQEQKEKE